MSKSRYVTGLRAVEQLLATSHADVQKLYAEYQTANPRVEAIIKLSQGRGIEIQPANRARLTQLSGRSPASGCCCPDPADHAARRVRIEDACRGGA